MTRIDSDTYQVLIERVLNHRLRWVDGVVEGLRINEATGKPHHILPKNEVPGRINKLRRLAEGDDEAEEYLEDEPGNYGHFVERADGKQVNAINNCFEQTGSSGFWVADDAIEGGRE